MTEQEQAKIDYIAITYELHCEQHSFRCDFEVCDDARCQMAMICENELRH